MLHCENHTSFGKSLICAGAHHLAVFLTPTLRDRQRTKGSESRHAQRPKPKAL